MLCTIWYHLYNLKNVENTHGGHIGINTPASPGKNYLILDFTMKDQTDNSAAAFSVKCT